MLSALELHGSESGECERAREGLELAFAPLWARMPFLDLQCSSSGLLWSGETVLAPDEDDHELVPTLTSSGIHGLMLVPGVEREDMARLLQIVDQKRRLDEHGDQDLVLALFRADLRHVRYTVGPVVGSAGALGTTTGGVAETPPERSVGANSTDGSREPGRDLDTDPAPDAQLFEITAAVVEEPPTASASPPLRETAESPAPDSSTESADSTPGTSSAGSSDAPPARPSPARIRALVEQDLATAPAPIDSADHFDSAAQFLDDAEIEYLTNAIDQEYARDHVRGVLSLLLDTFEAQKDGEVRDEVVGVLQNLLPYLLGTGRFPAVAYLTGELRKLIRVPHLEPRHRVALDQMRLAVSETDALTQLFHMLDDGSVDPSAEALGALLREMRPDALQSVLVWIGQLRRPRAKSALVQALENYFSESPAAIEPMMTSSDRAVVQRALAIAGKLERPEFAEPVAAALQHNDAGTRRLAVSALALIGTPAALKLMVPAIEDTDTEVRMTVFEALTQRPFRGAARTLSQVLTTTDVEVRDVTERRALFTAFATANGSAGVTTLETVLLGKGGLSRRPSAGTRACAALALGMLNTPAARFALEAAAKDKDPLVRSAAGAALRPEGLAS
jgi:HEAT repeat protein